MVSSLYLDTALANAQMHTNLPEQLFPAGMAAVSFCSISAFADNRHLQSDALENWVQLLDRAALADGKALTVAVTAPHLKPSQKEVGLRCSAPNEDAQHGIPINTRHQAFSELQAHNEADSSTAQESCCSQHHCQFM